MTNALRLGLGLALGALLAALPLLHFGWGGSHHAASKEDSHASHATSHVH
ncbi:MAG: hypothetical protein KIT14_04485 [bacterium]|nr:hypothetical protein [bacterium]